MKQWLSGHLIEFLYHEGELPEHVVEVGVNVDHSVIEALNLHSAGRRRFSKANRYTVGWLNWMALPEIGNIQPSVRDSFLISEFWQSIYSAEQIWLLEDEPRQWHFSSITNAPNTCPSMVPRFLPVLLTYPSVTSFTFSSMLIELDTWWRTKDNAKGCSIKVPLLCLPGRTWCPSGATPALSPSPASWSGCQGPREEQVRFRLWSRLFLPLGRLAVLNFTSVHPLRNEIQLPIYPAEEIALSRSRSKE